MLIPKQNFIRDKNHLAFIRKLPCIVCGKSPCEAAHIRTNSGAGTGIKPGDDRVVPLCTMCHKKQHATSEVKFYYPYGGWERAVVLAKALYEITGDIEKGKLLVMEYRA